MQSCLLVVQQSVMQNRLPLRRPRYNQIARFVTSLPSAGLRLPYSNSSCIAGQDFRCGPCGPGRFLRWQRWRRACQPGRFAGVAQGGPPFDRWLPQGSASTLSIRHGTTCLTGGFTSTVRSVLAVVVSASSSHLSQPLRLLGTTTQQRTPGCRDGHQREPIPRRS